MEETKKGLFMTEKGQLFGSRSRVVRLQWRVTHRIIAVVEIDWRRHSEQDDWRNIASLPE